MQGNLLSNLILLFGIVLLVVMGVTSPSYFTVQRNGVVYKMEWVKGRHSPLIQRERDPWEVLGRVGAVGGATALLFFWLRKQRA
jgi:hypothetical protein